MKQSIPAECTAIGLIKKVSLQPAAATRTSVSVFRPDIYLLQFCVFCPVLLCVSIYAGAEIHVSRLSEPFCLSSTGTARRIHPFSAVSALDLCWVHWCTVVTVTLTVMCIAGCSDDEG